jgi:hypothetical protein
MFPGTSDLILGNFDITETGFEIFMTGEGFEAYLAKTQLDNRTISATSSEEPWGDCYFIIPPSPFLSAPDQSSVTGITALENREYHTFRIYKILEDE